MKTLGIRLLLIAAVVLAPLAAHGQEAAAPSWGSSAGISNQPFYWGIFGVLLFYVLGGLFAWRRAPRGLLRAVAALLALGGIAWCVLNKTVDVSLIETAGHYLLMAYFATALICILPGVSTAPWWQRILHFQIYPIAAIADGRSWETLPFQLFLILPFILLCFRTLEPPREQSGAPTPSASDLGNTTLLFGIGGLGAWVIVSSVKLQLSYSDYISAAGVLAFIAAAFTTAAQRRVAMSAGLVLIGFLGAIGLWGAGFILDVIRSITYFPQPHTALLGATGMWMVGAYLVAAFLAAASFARVPKVPRWGQHLLHFVFCPAGLAFTAFSTLSEWSNVSFAIFGGALVTVLPFVLLCYRLDDWRAPVTDIPPP